MNEKEKLREQIRKVLNTILDEEYDAMLQEMKSSQNIINEDDNVFDLNDSQTNN